MSSDDDRLFAEAMRKVFWPSFIVGIALVLLLGIWNSPAGAHDAKHPELNDWFKSLNSKSGSCCAEMDGTFDPDWESKDGHYRVRIEGEWKDVPEDAVLKSPNLSGRTIVWWYKFSPWGTKSQIMIRCFMPGAMI